MAVLLCNKLQKDLNRKYRGILYLSSLHGDTLKNTPYQGIRVSALSNLEFVLPHSCYSYSLLAKVQSDEELAAKDPSGPDLALLSTQNSQQSLWNSMETLENMQFCKSPKYNSDKKRILWREFKENNS